jgi:hypothetical protein
MVRGRDFNTCVRCRARISTGEWHHRRSRSVVDEHQHAPCNGLWLCSTCHAWVHAHPFEARAMGWIVSRYMIPCEMPVFAQQHGWVLLGHDSDVSPTTDPREE